MKYSLVQSKISSTAAIGVTTTYDATPKQNNLLIASVINTSAGTTPPTVSDSNGNWTLACGLANGIVNRYGAIYYKIADASQPTAITCTQASVLWLMNIYEFQGNSTANTLAGLHDGTVATGTSSVTNMTTSDSLAVTTVATRTFGDSLVFFSCGLANTSGGSSTINESGGAVPDNDYTLGLHAPVGTTEKLMDWYLIPPVTRPRPQTHAPYATWATARGFVTTMAIFTPRTGFPG